MVKLSRFRFGWSTTRTELPVLDFARTAQRRPKNEKKNAPRDSNMVVYPLVSDPGRVGAFDDDEGGGARRVSKAASRPRGTQRPGTVGPGSAI